MKSKRNKTQPGFTTVEILIVIAILSIVAAIAMPMLAQSREWGKVATCIGHLHSIGHSIELYQNDTDGYLPPVNFNDPLAFVDPETGSTRLAPHPLRSYGLSFETGQCPRAFPDGATGLGEPRIDYTSKFVIDLTERTPKAGKYSYIPRPSNVLVWDWNHTVNNDLTNPGTRWTALRADGSVFRVAGNQVQHMYLIGGTWTLTVDPDKRNDYPYVFLFPGETWPPDSTSQLP